MVISQRKGLRSTKHIREKGPFYTYNLREKGTSRTFLDKHAYTFNKEWPRRNFAGVGVSGNKSFLSMAEIQVFEWGGSVPYFSDKKEF